MWLLCRSRPACRKACGGRHAGSRIAPDVDVKNSCTTSGNPYAVLGSFERSSVSPTRWLRTDSHFCARNSTQRSCLTNRDHDHAASVLLRRLFTEQQTSSQHRPRSALGSAPCFDLSCHSSPLRHLPQSGNRNASQFDSPGISYCPLVRGQALRCSAEGRCDARCLRTRFNTRTSTSTTSTNTGGTSRLTV